MTGNENKYALRWDDFEKNIVGAFKELRNDNDFFDCTIVCNDKKIRAHRVILSACSPTFREMIRCTTHHHPVLYLRGVRQEDVEALLDFMYYGEAFLEEDELEAFLKTAEDLQVRGLCQVGSSSGETTLEEDIQSVLRTLDEPQSKRIKREPEAKEKEAPAPRLKGGLLSSFGPGLSVSVKQEPRERKTDILNSLQAQKSTSQPSRSASSDSTQDALKSILMQDDPVPEPANPVSISPRISVPYIPQASSASNIAPSSMTSPLTISNSPHVPTTPLRPMSISSANSISAAVPFSSHLGKVTTSSSIVTPVNLSAPVVTQSMVPVTTVTSSVDSRFTNNSLINPRISQAQILSGCASPPVLHLPEHYDNFQRQVIPTPNQLNIQVPNIGSRSAETLTNIVQSRDANQSLVTPNMTTQSLQNVLQMNVLQGQHLNTLQSHQQSLHRISMSSQQPSIPDLSQSQQLQASTVLAYSSVQQGVPIVHGNQAEGLSHAQQVQIQQEPLEPGGGEEGQDLEYQRLIESYIERDENEEGPIVKCRACDKFVKFKNKKTLISHVESTHLETNLSCTYCKKTFKATNYLKQHLKRGSCTAGRTDD